MGQKLNRVLYKQNEYKRLLVKIEELEAIATRVTPILSDLPKGGSSTPDDRWSKLVDYKLQLQACLDQYAQDCIELEDELECIKSERVRVAMKYKYIDGLSVERLAECLETDERYAYKLLARGRKIYEETYRDW